MVLHAGTSSGDARRVLASLGLAQAPTPRRIAVGATVVTVGALAAVAISRILERTGGTPAAPLDDAYIHFQFARSFARGEPLVYSPGAPAVAGATSLLWPFLLATPYALGLREHTIVWASWALGFSALGLLAWEAKRAAERFCSPLVAFGASALILAFGANLWFAASGMEVVPLAWLLLRSARRAAEWCERDGPPTEHERRSRHELLALAYVLPLLRPEGAIGTVLIAAAFALRAGGRVWSPVAATGLFASPLVTWALTGQLSSTTARAKWLPFSPYVDAADLLSSVQEYTELLVSTLLDGEIWSALFLPSGSAPVALLSLAALLVAGYRRGLWVRAVFLFLLALGVLIPATYDCPLCNRLRYLWPFIPAWMVGTAALCELIGDLVSRVRRELAGVSLLLVGSCVGALGGYLPFAIEDLATSCRAIFSQQVSLGLWARNLPESTRIGLNDAGALTYFSGRPTFDIVGLTTAGEARYWVAGSGSRFEHYERLGPANLPTHFIVYPEWFGIDALLGPELTARYVPDASILGGPRMSVHVADYATVRSAEQPDPAVAARQHVIDRVDVADLESEAAHGYELFDARRQENTVFDTLGRLDGGRSGRTVESFELRVVPGGSVVLRVAADTAVRLEVLVGAHRSWVDLPPSRWHESRMELPSSIAAGKTRILIRPAAGTFSALHYFSLAPSTKR